MTIFGFFGMRNTNRPEEIPNGTLHAPLWVLDKRENHGMGYHIHILKLVSGKYVRTNAALTVKNSQVLIFFHNDGAKVNISEDDITERFKAELREQLNGTILKIPPEAWRPITKDKSIFMFNT